MTQRPLAPGSLVGASVLLIDDDMVSREVTATVLTMKGYAVHTASDGAAGLRMLTPQREWPNPLHPGVIVVDSQMPGLSGTRLIDELRKFTRAPIFVISGSDPEPEVIEAANGFLLKPFSVEAFRKLLDGGRAELTPTTRGPKSAAISAEVLGQFRKLMPEPAVRQVYEAVVTDLERRIDSLAAAIARGDDAEVRRIGHTIKGGCGMAGAMEAARLGELLESGDNQLDNRISILGDLRAATRRLRNMLDAELPA